MRKECMGNIVANGSLDRYNDFSLSNLRRDPWKSRYSYIHNYDCEYDNLILENERLILENEKLRHKLKKYEGNIKRN